MTSKTLTRDELIELAERCEKASGPYRDLDAKISRAVGGYSETKSSFAPEPFTASLDAAMSLVPEGWRVAEMGETVIDCDDPWQVKLLEKRFTGERAKCSQGDAATPALALCAAALRARGNQS